MSDLNHIDLKAIPEHIAIIMDGNGRWAKTQGEDRIFGHTKGVDAVRETLRAAADLKVKFLTLYAFSTENWNRPKEEVEGLMNLLVMSLANELEELNENGVRLQAIGNIKGLPKECQESLQEAMFQTRNNANITLVYQSNSLRQGESAPDRLQVIVAILLANPRICFSSDSFKSDNELESTASISHNRHRTAA